MITTACVRFYTKALDGTYLFPAVPSIMFDIPCHRHADAFYIISQFIDADEIDKQRTEQGFLTHEGLFLNRHQALQHAIACGQLPPDINRECDELYSEDLW